MSNSLTRRTTLGFMPLFLRVLLRHYYNKLSKKSRENASAVVVPLRREELMYDEAFSIVRNFMDATIEHTVEELQRFSQLRLPAPPSVYLVRLSVPISCCADAARVVIEVFGGEREVKRTIGGARWWQVRSGNHGIDAEWIMEKHDWREAVRREREASATMGSENAPRTDSGSSSRGSYSAPPGGEWMSASDANTGTYSPGIDEMRCLLWAHGGGYYFGSVDQESAMRARYVEGCSLQTIGLLLNIPSLALFRTFSHHVRIILPCLPTTFEAAPSLDLFLKRPPEGATHKPVKPSNIVVGGDSAGGGLAMALLQVIRDADLPLPAGAVLVSPWCDLHHSFPSILLNTKTDIIPVTGLTICKPSPLWPPPPDDVHLTVRDLLRKAAMHGVDHPKRTSETEVPMINADQPDAQPGKALKSTRQIQLYTTNELLKHPLVSPVLAYLGGLPPLLVIASDREVLRDEILYTAHRAANPAKYPVSEEVKKLYPAYEGIEGRMKSTTVHLQVYDDTAHVVPLAFMGTTPAKFCYRAIATFIKHVTNMPTASKVKRHEHFQVQPSSNITSQEAVSSPSGLSLQGPPASLQDKERSSSRVKYSLRAITSARKGRSNFSKVSNRHPNPRLVGDEGSVEGSDVFAGDPIVYHKRWTKSPEPQRIMIRERVAINGAVRPLEVEEELPALQVVPELLGVISEIWLSRYVTATENHEKKFATHINNITARRERAIAKLRQKSSQSSRRPLDEAAAAVSSEGSGWSLAWALDENEFPPPSSLVARCDTTEALEFMDGASRKGHLKCLKSKMKQKRAKRQIAGARSRA